MSHYTYRCFQCNKTYAAELVEKELMYLCPACGSANRNQPLTGVLLVDYDFDSLKKKLSREAFLKQRAGRFWLTPELYPLQKPVNSSLMDRIALPATGLPYYSFDGNSFSVLDDTGNPTLSYKDRATSLVVAKAIEMGITEIAAASTGNAGSSLAGISARLGIRSHIFVPQNIPLGKRIQIQSFGAAIYIIKGSYDDAFDLSLEISNQKKWYNRNTAYNPLTIEGKKSSAFDIFILSQGKMPDNIFVPVGDGVIIAGIYRGLEDLLKLGWIEKLPKLIALQAKGSDAVCRYMKDKSFSFIEGSTIADSISAGAPRNLYHATHAIEQTGGAAIAVTDADILKAQKTMVQKTGILVEPSCAIAFAGYQEYKASGKLKEGETSLLMLTGNGLKDTNSLAKWNDTPDVLSYQEWKNYFAKA